MLLTNPKILPKKGRCVNIFMQTLIEKPARLKKTTLEVRNCGDHKVGIEEQIIYSKRFTDDSKRGKEGRGSTNSIPHLHPES